MSKAVFVPSETFFEFRLSNSNVEFVRLFDCGFINNTLAEAFVVKGALIFLCARAGAGFFIDVTLYIFKNFVIMVL